MIAILSVNSDIEKESKYLLQLASSVSQCCDYLVACTSANIEQGLFESLQKICSKVCKYDSYIDANKWKYMLLEELDREAVLAADSLLLVNDSMFGPVFPLDNVFRRADLTEVDFWGLTAHGRMKLQSGTEWPRFIQSYFMVFNHSLLASDYFWAFFESLPLLNDFDKASELYEYSITDYFEQRGFRWKVLMDTKDHENDDEEFYMSFILFDLYRLISEMSFPFVPKYIFDIDPMVMQVYHMGNDVSKTMEYIEKNTDYDVSLIYSNLVARMNLYDIQTRLNLNYVLSAGTVNCENRMKVGVFAYLYYDDLIPYSVSKLANAPDYCDIFIGTDSEEKRDQIRAECNNRFLTQNVKILMHQGKGRDLSALLVTFRNYLMEYDLICFIHDKKSAHFSYSTVGQAFNENLWENMFASKEYVNSILNLFIEKAYLGFVSPPMIEHNLYFHTSIDSWTICMDQTCKIADMLGLHIMVDRAKNPVSLGSAFWCRTKALKPLFEHQFQFDDFADEPMPVDGTFSHGLERIFPYVAQHEGYCSGVIMTKAICATNYNAYREKLNLILREIDQFKGVDTATLWTTVMSLRKLKIGRKNKEKRLLRDHLFGGKK